VFPNITAQRVTAKVRMTVTAQTFLGSEEEFVSPQPFCWVSINVATHVPQLERDGGLYRPVYWAFQRDSESLSGTAGIDRPA